MKKLLPVAFFLFLFSYTFSQWCAKNFKEIDTCRFFPLNMSWISILEIDESNTVWFNLNNSWGDGGFEKISESDTLRFYSDSDLEQYMYPKVNAIAFDKKDSVWVGTLIGLAQFDGISQTGWKIFKTSNSAIPSNNITAIQIDENNVKWIGTHLGELVSFYNGVWDSVRYFNNEINDIAIDNQGGVWVAKKGTPGLARLYDDVWTDYNQFSDIEYITHDQFNRILVSSADSLVVMFNQNIVNVVKGREDWILYDIAVGPGGRVWVSSNRGLLLKSGKRFYRFDQYNSPVFLNQYRAPLEFDTEGNLWYAYQYRQGGIDYPGIGYIYRSAENATPIEVTNDISITDGSIQQPISNFPVAAFCFGDSVVMEAAGNADNYVWGEDGTATNQSFTIYDAEADSDTIPLAYKAPDQCYYYDTIRVIAQHVFEDEEICVVTVSLDTHNLIVFEKTPEVGTEFYYLYREVKTGEYDYITQLPATRLSVFVDETSDPRVKSYKYKITSVDTCGNESDEAETYFHKTMHLIFDPEQGTLVWQNYEGMHVPEYIIYKGNSPNETDMVEVDRVPWDDVTMTWKDVNVTGLHYYRVGVELDKPCFPSGNVGKKADAGPYSHAMSNVEDNRLQVGLIQKLSIIQVNAWPNPFSAYTRIRFESPGNTSYELTVMDISGKVVRKLGGITGSMVTFERHDLPAGFYTFDLQGENRYVGRFIIQ
jgi:hypothetical protein